MEHIHDGSNPVNYYLIGAGHLTDSSEDHMVRLYSWLAFLSL